MSAATATVPNENVCVGSRLGEARIQKGIPIEQAARDTRIRSQRLLEIENDDFSQFAHPSYARMFLMDYARYLGVPLQDIQDLLPERGECGSEGYQYLCEPVEEEFAVSRRRAPRRRFLPFVRSVLTIGFIFAITIYGWVIYRNVSRIGLDRLMNGEVKLSSLQKVSEDSESPETAGTPIIASPAETADGEEVFAQREEPAITTVSDSDPSMLQSHEPLTFSDAAVPAPSASGEILSTGDFTGAQPALSLNGQGAAGSLR